eukprot:gene45085-61075_t
MAAIPPGNDTLQSRVNVIAHRHDQYPIGVDRPREIQCLIGHLLETERHVIGRVADQDDAFRAIPPCRVDGDPAELP